MTDFVFTENAQTRIKLIKTYTSWGIPVLLVGQTGTGKTASAEEAFKDEKDNIIKFNFSAETTIDQLIGHPSIEGEDGFGFQSGDFLLAFENGYPLILDEFNLAHEDVLQCIEAALDSGFITIDNPVTGYKKIKRHQNFKLVATQNEAKFDFARKRNEISSKLKSEFKVIEFENISSEELKEIAKKTEKQIEIPDEDIDKLITFHNEWNEKCFEMEGDQILFTIRNIKSVLKSVSEDVSLYKAVLLNYGSSYNENTLELVRETMVACGIMPDEEEKEYQFPEIKSCFKNDSISDTFEKIQFFLNQEQLILLVGEDGCGKTQIAKWASEVLLKNEPNMVICTPETNISDLIGNYIPIKHDAIGHLPVKWFDGPIIKSLLEGKCIILDQIERALPQYIERINPLFDAYSKKGKGKETYFTIYERPTENKILIKDGFKFIATASKNELSKLSPALLNRFVIINVENQLKNIKYSIFNDKFISTITETQIGYKTVLRIFELAKTESIATVIKVIKGICLMRKYTMDDNMSFEIFNQIFVEGKTPTLPVQIANSITNEIKETKYFHYKNVKELVNIFAIISIMRKMGQHCILQSTTGIGKTSAAMMLAESLKLKPYKVSFNNETKISDLIGNLTITNGEFNNASGMLYKAIKEGGIFIADEINLAETTVMESLTMALEQKEGEMLNLPNCQISVNKNFFFIGCQNDTTMFGRKQLPHCICKKVVLLEYPFPRENLKDIIKSIFDENLGNYRFTTNNIAVLVQRMLDHPVFMNRPWSFREVRRYMNRCIYFNKSANVTKRNGKPLDCYVHAAFMIYSTLRKQKEHIDDIVNLISESFVGIDKEELKADLNDTVEVERNGSQVILTKGNIKQKVNDNDGLVSEATKTYWETMFLINMIPSNEPLLLSGPTSFKTFISKQISNNPRVVSLSRNSNTSSLIGSISLVDRASVTTFLFDTLSSIIISTPTLIYRLNELKKVFSGTDDEIYELKDIVEQINKEVPDYKFITNNIYNGIIENIKPSSSSSYMKNFTTSFKPGLITTKVLQQKTLILKNFSKPSVSVIERFNELFSINPELTLTEDFTNTIVPAGNATIKLPETHFRIIATCGENESNYLSEAMLSRLNVINVNKYTEEDQKEIFKTFYDKRFEEMSFINSNKIVSIAKDILKISNNGKWANQKITDKEALNFSFKLMNNKEEIQNDEETPLSINNAIISSKFSPIKAVTSVTKFSKTDLLFTPSIQVMIDRIFSAFALNRPLIIYGPNGNGKSMAVEYVANSFGIQEKNIIKIQISHSTTTESLYGKNEINNNNGKNTYDFVPTQLLKAISDNSEYYDGETKLIILEELNLATQEVIDALAPLFDGNEKSRILQPNGIDTGKGKFLIVGLASDKFDMKDLSYGSIIFEKEDYNEEEMKEICTEIMTNNNCDDEDKHNFITGILTLREQLKTNKSVEIASVRLCNEWILLNSVFKMYSKLKNFSYDISFNSFDSVKPIPIETPPISIEMTGTSIKVSDLQVEINTDTSRWEENASNVLSLSESEKKLFTVLAANAQDDKRFPLIVKGPTASGKTFTIQLFANIIGQKLTVLQMNSDSSIASIIGGYKISEETTKRKIEDIKAKLAACGTQFDDMMKRLDEANTVTVNTLKSFITRIDKVLATTPDDKIKAAKIEIEDACLNIFNRVKLADSVLVEAMVNGDWILLDNIEAASSDIIERIITLLNPNPTLNIYERGSKCVYSADPHGDEIKIHKKFRLFITYNPNVLHKKTILTNAVTSRCIVYSMKPFDETVVSSAIASFYHISDLKNPKKKEILACKIGNIHVQRRKRTKDQENEVNGRTLMHICRAVSHYRNKINERRLKKILKDNYSAALFKEFDEVEGLNEDYNSKIKESELKEIQDYIKNACDKNESLLLILDQFTKVPRYNDLLDTLRKFNFDKIDKVIEEISKLLSSLNEKIDDEIEEETSVAFQILLLSKIKEILVETKEHLVPEIAELSFSTVDMKTYPYFYSINFLMDRISDLLTSHEKVFPNFMFSQQKDLNYYYHSLFDKVQYLALLTTKEIDIQDYLAPSFEEIFVSYQICLEENNRTAFNQVTKFYELVLPFISDDSCIDDIESVISELDDDDIEQFYKEINLTFCTENIGNLIDRIEEEYKDLFDFNNDDTFQNNMFESFAEKIINNNLENCDIYKILYDNFIRLGFELPNEYFEEIEEAIEMTKREIEYDFTIFHELQSDSNKKEKTEWFVELVKYNVLMKSVKQLADPNTKFCALVKLIKYLSGRPSVEIILNQIFNENNLRSPEIANIMIEEDIKHNYFENMNNNEFYTLIDPNNMKDQLDYFYSFEDRSISNEWIKSIKEINTFADLEQTIIIPQITESDFVFISNLFFNKELKDIKNSDKIINTICKMQITPENERQIDFLIPLQGSIDQQVNYKAKDSIPYIRNEKEYFETNLEEAIFLSKNSKASHALEKAMNNHTLTYGVFILRLFANSSLIAFYSTNPNFPKEYKESIGKAVKQLINDKRIDSTALIASFLLDSVPSGLKHFTGSLFHDSIEQVVTFSNDENYQNAVKEYLSKFVSDYIKNSAKDKQTWKKEIDTGKNSFILDPLNVFINKANAYINENRIRYEENISKKERERENQVSIIKEYVDKLIHSTKLDETQFKSKFAKNNNITQFLNKYNRFSESFLAFYETIPQIFGDKKEITFIKKGEQFFKKAKKIDIPEIQNSRKLTLLYKPKMSKGVYIFEKDDGSGEKFQAEIKFNGAAIIRVPEGVSIKGICPDHILNIYVAKEAKPSKSPLDPMEYYNSICDIAYKFDSVKEEFNKVKNTYDEVYQVKFSGKPFAEVKDFLNEITKESIIEKFKTFTDIQFNVSKEDYKPENTIKCFNDLENDVKIYESKLADINELENKKSTQLHKIQLESNDFEVKPLSLQYKYDQILLNSINNPEPLKVPAITVLEDSIETNLRKLDVSIDNVIRTIQNTPIKISIFCFGDSQTVKLQIKQNDLSLPTMYYEAGDGVITLVIPIENISEEKVEFSGEIIFLNKQFAALPDPIQYSVKVSFINPTILLHSEGNSFNEIQSGVYQMNGHLFKQESTYLTSQLIGIEKPYQFVLFENNDIKSKLPSPPIRMTNIPGEASYKFEDDKKIGYVTVECYYSNSTKIVFNTQKSHSDEPICKLYFFDHISKKFIDYSKAKIEAGNLSTIYYLQLYMILPSEDIPKITLNSSNPRVIAKLENDFSSMNPAKIVNITIPFSIVVTSTPNNAVNLDLCVTTKAFGERKYTFRVKTNINSYNSINLYEKYYFNNNEWTKTPPMKRQYTLTVNENSYHFEYYKNDVRSDFKVKYDDEGVFSNYNEQRNIRGIFIGEKYGTVSVSIHYINRDNVKDALILFKDNIEEYWWPGMSSGISTDMISRISSLSEKQYFTLMDYFAEKTRMSKEESENIIKRLKNTQKYDSRENIGKEVLKFINDKIKDRLNEMKARNMHIFLPCEYQTIISKHQEIQNKLPKPSSDNIKFISDENYNDTKLQLDKQAERMKGKKYIMLKDEETSLIDESEKERIMKNNCKIEIKNESDLTKGKKIQFSELQKYTKTINTPYKIYKYINDVYELSKKFSNTLSSYFENDKMQEIPILAYNQFEAFTSLYVWSHKESTLKRTSFLSLIKSFNQSYRDIVNRLISSGVKMPEEIRSFAGVVQNNVEAPKQEEINLINKEKKWNMIESAPTIIKFPSLPKPPKQEPKKPEEKKKGTSDRLINTLAPNKKEGINNANKEYVKLDKINELTSWILKNLTKSMHLEGKETAKAPLPKFNDVSDDILVVKTFVKASRHLAIEIVKAIRKEGVEKFEGTEVFLMLDVGFFITAEQKTALFISYIAFSIALSLLNIPTCLSLFGDINFQIVIKKQDEELQLSTLQKVLDTLLLQRKVSDVLTALRNNAIFNFSPASTSHSVFIFTDGLLVNTTPESWKNVWNGNSKESMVTNIILQNGDKSIINDINKANKYMNVIPNYRYTIFENCNDIYENESKLIVSFISGLIQSKAYHQIKDEVKVIIPKEVLKGNKTITPEKIDGDEIFVSKREGYDFESQKLPRIIMDNRLDKYTVRFENKDKIDLHIDEKALQKGTKLQHFFLPNKPTQATPSEKGYGISIIGLIRCAISYGQDKRIYLEKNSGYVPSYSLFAVVDCCSTSCSFFAIQHAIQTVVSLLSSLSKCENVPFTLIAATSEGPVVLCMNTTLIEIINNDSPVILSLIQYMMNPSTISSLSDSLNAVYTIRSKQIVTESKCLVFTSGQVRKAEKISTTSIIAAMETLKISVIGVGIGICSPEISDIFKLSIWSQNPENIQDAMYYLIKEERKGKITYPSYNVPDKETLEECAQIIKRSKPVYSTFYDSLRYLPVSLESTKVYLNDISASIQKKKISGRGGNGTSNKINQNEMQDDLGKGGVWKIRILLCQFWDKEMAHCVSSKDGDNENITYKCLVDEKYGVISELKKKGMTVDIVQNYREAISCLVSGNYNQCWVICGRGDLEGPKTRPLKDKPKWASKAIYEDHPVDHDLAIVFAQTLEEFRIRGGGLAFWGDASKNYTFTYELDYYLQYAKLYNQTVVDESDNREPVKIRFNNIDPTVKKILYPGNIFNENNNLVKIPATFDIRDSYWQGLVERNSYGYNVYNLFEGETVCGADPSNIEPFNIFSISSNGYVSSAYYMSPLNLKEGDIIIDGAASRLFMELSEEGIRRLVVNMAVWLTSYWKYNSTYHNMLPEAARSVKPEKFNILDIPKEKPAVYKKKEIESLDLCFAIDSTESTGFIKEILEKSVNDIIKVINKEYHDKKIRVAIVAFRDKAMVDLFSSYYGTHESFYIERNKSDKLDFVNINTRKDDIISFLEQIEPKGGGGDGPEDWVDAFTIANGLKWREESDKFMFLLTDSNCHGIGFHGPISEQVKIPETEIKKFDEIQGEKMDKEIDCLIEKNIQMILLGTPKYQYIENVEIGFNKLVQCYKEKSKDNIITQIIIKKREKREIVEFAEKEVVKILKEKIRETFMAHKTKNTPPSLFPTIVKKRVVNVPQPQPNIQIQSWANVAKPKPSNFSFDDILKQEEKSHKK